MLYKYALKTSKIATNKNKYKSKFYSIYHITLLNHIFIKKTKISVNGLKKIVCTD